MAVFMPRRRRARFAKPFRSVVQRPIAELMALPSCCGHSSGAAPVMYAATSPSSSCERSTESWFSTMCSRSLKHSSTVRKLTRACSRRRLWPFDEITAAISSSRASSVMEFTAAVGLLPPEYDPIASPPPPLGRMTSSGGGAPAAPGAAAPCGAAAASAPTAAAPPPSAGGGGGNGEGLGGGGEGGGEGGGGEGGGDGDGGLRSPAAVAMRRHAHSLRSHSSQRCSSSRARCRRRAAPLATPGRCSGSARRRSCLCSRRAAISPGSRCASSMPRRAAWRRPRRRSSCGMRRLSPGASGGGEGGGAGRSVGGGGEGGGGGGGGEGDPCDSRPRRREGDPRRPLPLRPPPLWPPLWPPFL